jgi:UDP-glucose 4-epimerase
MQKTILVTGGAGFIGSHLCERLLKGNYKVICFDNLSTGSLENIKEFQDRLSFVQGDINVYSDVEPIFNNNNLDKVFHYAAIVGVQRTAENPIEVLNDVIGIRNIFELALKYNKPKVIFASSSEVYGEPVEIPEKEDGHLNPKIPYAVVKLYGEKMIEAYWQKYQLPGCALRFFNVYGPKQESSDYGFVIGIFIKKVLKNEPLIIYGDGSQTRNFVFIDDNIEASILASETEKTNGEVFNVGTGNPISILNLAREIISITNKDLEIIFEPSRNDIKHRFPDVEKIQHLLNFKPQIPLKEGLQKTIEFYKNYV